MENSGQLAPGGWDDKVGGKAWGPQSLVRSLGLGEEKAKRKRKW
jgi:hypothetical protein